MYAERDSGREVEEIKGKKSEVKDPNIKFFGKSIGLPETFAATAAVAICEVAHSCDVAGEESSIQDFPCSSNSMFEESNLNGDAEDQEANKVLTRIYCFVACFEGNALIIELNIMVQYSIC